MPTPRSGLTKRILAQDPALDNRQVADLLNVDISLVMNARRYHGVVHKKEPRDRGLKQKILDAGKTISTRELSEILNCSRSYIKLVRRNNP